MFKDLRDHRYEGNYLLWGKAPADPVQKGAVEMVFASNVDRYCKLAGI